MAITAFRRLHMKLPSFLERLVLYLRLNGYSNPTQENAGKFEKIITIPQKALRALSVLCGIFLERRFDRKHHVETCGAIPLEDLEIDGESADFGVLYDTIPYRSFHHLLSRLPQENLSDFSFIDYGSGKGRVLLMAAELPFKKIVGVEFAKSLHESALANIETFISSRQVCHDIEPLLEDATLYDPPCGSCVLFFFVPFHGEVLAKVFSRIRDSWHRDPRPIYILWVTDPETHPFPYEELQAMATFEELESDCFPFDPGKRYPLAYLILRATPSGAEDA